MKQSLRGFQTQKQLVKQAFSVAASSTLVASINPLGKSSENIAPAMLSSNMLQLGHEGIHTHVKSAQRRTETLSSYRRSLYSAIRGGRLYVTVTPRIIPRMTPIVTTAKMIHSTTRWPLQQT